MLVATASGLIHISLDTDDYTPMLLSYASTNFTDAKIMHVDYDPIEKKLYFIDGDRGVIKRCGFNGTEFEVCFVIIVLIFVIWYFLQVVSDFCIIINIKDLYVYIFI